MVEEIDEKTLYSRIDDASDDDDFEEVRILYSSDIIFEVEFIMKNLNPILRF